MAQKASNVDSWLKRETPHIRKALENASTYFDHNDILDVHTLEAVYAKESSFGTLLHERGIDSAAGEFQLYKATAKQYGLSVSKENDQHFDIDYASIAAICFGIFRIDGFFAERNMQRIVTACEQYKEKYKTYPNKLDLLVPEFMSSIPKAMRVGVFNEFHYGASPDYHFIFYVAIPPFGRPGYDLDRKKHTFID